MADQLGRRIDTIEAQRRELEAVMSSMVEGVVAVDRDEMVIGMNDVAAGLLGSARGRAVGRSIQEVARDPDLTAMVQGALAGSGTLERDVRLGSRDETCVKATATDLRDGEGEMIGALLVLNDVTRLRRLENMRRDFAANVSHEIKTPLTAITGFVETLRHGRLEDPEEISRFLGIIERHVQRLAAIIDDLIKLSRIERDAETRDIALLNEDIRTVVDAAVGLCRQAAAARNIRIIRRLPADVVTGRISAPLLEQALVNLIDNAVKYSPDGTEVVVSLGVDDRTTRITVSDQGPGIARQHLPRLFERFYRVDKARSRKMGGTGLGLAIVKHIAQAHGGEVTVDSALGRGTCFTITLPHDGADSDKASA
jgi:two-component system phosphate regulon sensor histidine kinase PhoR